jgi:hypothetical protein
LGSPRHAKRVPRALLLFDSPGIPFDALASAASSLPPLRDTSTSCALNGFQFHSRFERTALGALPEHMTKTG